MYLYLDFFSGFFYIISVQVLQGTHCGFTMTCDDLLI